MVKRHHPTVRNDQSDDQYLQGREVEYHQSDTIRCKHPKFTNANVELLERLIDHESKYIGT